jgi:putative hydrolase of HD superfamily
MHPIINLFSAFYTLKRICRQGWLNNHVPENLCESVAEHSFVVALLAMVIADANFPDYDINRIIRMALIHDIGEIYVGDLVPGSGIDPKKKHLLEKDAFKLVFKNIFKGDDYLKIWEEYEKGVTPEAKFVKEIDKLEMLLQAFIYDTQGFDVLREFQFSAKEGISSKVLQEIVDEIVKKQIDLGKMEGS